MSPKLVQVIASSQSAVRSICLKPMFSNWISPIQLEIGWGQFTELTPSSDIALTFQTLSIKLDENTNVYVIMGVDRNEDLKTSSNTTLSLIDLTLTAIYTGDDLLRFVFFSLGSCAERKSLE
jgi:hypothetical protein